MLIQYYIDPEWINITLLGVRYLSTAFLVILCDVDYNSQLKSEQHGSMAAQTAPGQTYGRLPLLALASDSAHAF